MVPVPRNQAKERPGLWPTAPLATGL